jgi:flavodoxin
MMICIAYYSKYGNGKEAAEHLRDALAKHGHVVLLNSVENIDPKLLPAVDLYVFSSPTHMGSPAGKMKRFLKKLAVPKGSKYALMTTYMGGNAKTLLKMEKILEKKGYVKAFDGLELKVEGSKGPLAAGYKTFVENFAQKIAK